MKTQTSRARRRRIVTAAGGYYSASSKSWVLPGLRSNLVPWAVQTEWFRSLELAAERVEGYADAVAQFRAYEQGESKLDRCAP